MKKYMRIWLLLMALVSVPLLATSCGDEDTEETGGKGGHGGGSSNEETSVALVGEWIYEHEYGYDTFVFMENGTGIGTENAVVGGELTGHATWTFKYTYDEASQILIMQHDSDKSDISIVTVIIHDNGDSFTYIDEEEEFECTFVRK